MSFSFRPPWNTHHQLSYMQVLACKPHDPLVPCISELVLGAAIAPLKKHPTPCPIPGLLCVFTTSYECVVLLNFIFIEPHLYWSRHHLSECTYWLPCTTQLTISVFIVSGVAFTTSAPIHVSQIGRTCHPPLVVGVGPRLCIEWPESGLYSSWCPA